VDGREGRNGPVAVRAHPQGRPRRRLPAAELPPVMIDGHLHTDGGVRQQIFVAERVFATLTRARHTLELELEHADAPAKGPPARSGTRTRFGSSGATRAT